MWLSGGKELIPILPHSFFSFTSMRVRHWQQGHSSNCKYGGNYKVLEHAQGGQKLRKDLRRPYVLYFRLILSIETTYNNKNKNRNKNQQTLGNGKFPRGQWGVSQGRISYSSCDFQNYHIIIFNVQFSTTTKNYKAYRETGKYGPFKRKNEVTETVPGKDLMVDLLDKGFKATILSSQQVNPKFNPSHWCAIIN